MGGSEQLTQVVLMSVISHTHHSHKCHKYEKGQMAPSEQHLRLTSDSTCMYSCYVHQCTHEHTHT